MPDNVIDLVDTKEYINKYQLRDQIISAVRSPNVKNKETLVQFLINSLKLEIARDIV